MAGKGTVGAQSLGVCAVAIEEVLDFTAGGGTRTRTDLSVQRILSSTEYRPPASTLSKTVH
jgi:hypothetical protein